MKVEVRNYIKEYLQVDDKYIDSHPSIEKLYRNNQLEKFKKIISKNRNLLDILSDWVLYRVNLDKIESILKLKELKEYLELLTSNLFKRSESEIKKIIPFSFFKTSPDLLTPNTFSQSFEEIEKIAELDIWGGGIW